MYRKNHLTLSLCNSACRRCASPMEKLTSPQDPSHFRSHPLLCSSVLVWPCTLFRNDQGRPAQNRQHTYRSVVNEADSRYDLAIMCIYERLIPSVIFVVLDLNRVGQGRGMVWPNEIFNRNRMSVVFSIQSFFGVLNSFAERERGCRRSDRS